MGTRVLLNLNQFVYKDADARNVFPVAVGSLLSVAFMNLNLTYNSVGFYQLSKLICIPVTLIIQYFAYKQSVSRIIQFTLMPILFGVGYATVYDLDVNFTGTVFATYAVLALQCRRSSPTHTRNHWTATLCSCCITLAL